MAKMIRLEAGTWVDPNQVYRVDYDEPSKGDVNGECVYEVSIYLEIETSHEYNFVLNGYLTLMQIDSLVQTINIAKRYEGNR